MTPFQIIDNIFYNLIIRILNIFIYVKDNTIVWDDCEILRSSWWLQPAAPDSVTHTLLFSYVFLLSATLFVNVIFPLFFFSSSSLIFPVSLSHPFIPSADRPVISTFAGPKKAKIDRCQP